MCEFSDYLEIYEKKNKYNFDKKAKKVSLIKLPWNQLMPNVLIKDALAVNPNIDFYSPKALIRVNKLIILF